ncbi:MAG: choice-of-anchor J domain-containing protein [Candidatus Yanofskybacteria bacterium]|nr:choice-of-anchor J domain-containing protein [Candidatus Yanofskybacteria bacterium]
MNGKFLLFLFSIFLASFVVFDSALASTIIFSDGFESDFSEWTGNDVKWATSGTSSATGVHGGLKRAQATGATDPGDDVLLKSVPTVGYQGIKLEFWHRIYKGLESEDHVYVEWTPDGSNWNVLDDFTTVGESANWQFTSYNLPAEADNKDNFAFRFRAHLGAASSDIFYLDDVVLSGDSQNAQTTLAPTSAPTSTPLLSPAPSPVITASPTPSPSVRPTPSPSPVSEATPTPVPSPVKLSVSSTPVPTAIKARIAPSTAPALIVEENTAKEFREESAEDGSLSASLSNLMGSNSFLLMGLMVLAVVSSLAKFRGS